MILNRYARNGPGIIESRAGPFVNFKIDSSSTHPEVQATSIFVFGDSPNSPYSKVNFIIF